MEDIVQRMRDTGKRGVKPPRHLTPLEELLALPKTMTAQARAGLFDEWEVEGEFSNYQQQRQEEKPPGPGWFERNIWKPMVTGLEVWNRYTAKPIAELATISLASIFGTDIVREQMGASQTALRTAWNQGGIQGYWAELATQRDKREGHFWGEKFFGELFSDPLNFVGFGLFGKLPLLGKALGPAEAAFVKAVNAVPSAMLWVGKRVPPWSASLRLSEAAIARGIRGSLYGAWQSLDPTGKLFSANDPASTKNLFTIIKARSVASPSIISLESVEKLGAEGLAAGVLTRASKYTWAIGTDPEQWLQELMEMAPSKAFDRLINRYLMSTTRAGQARMAQAMGQEVVVRKALLRFWDTHIQGLMENYIQPYLLRGPAELMLQFLNYMPFNILEDGVRSALGGSVPRLAYSDHFRHMIRFVRGVVPEELLAESKLADISRLWEGIAPAQLFGGKVLRGPLKFLGRWQLDMSAEWSTLIRRGFFESRYVQNLAKDLRGIGFGELEVEKLLLNMTKNMPNIPEAVIGLGRPGLAKQLKEFTLVSMLGGPDAVRDVKRFFGRAQINPARFADVVLKHSSDLSVASKRALRDWIASGSSPDAMESLFKGITKIESEVAMTEPDVLFQVFGAVRDTLRNAKVEIKTVDDYVRAANQMQICLERAEEGMGLVHGAFYTQLEAAETAAERATIYRAMNAKVNDYAKGLFTMGMGGTDKGIMEEALSLLDEAGARLPQTSYLTRARQALMGKAKDLGETLRKDRAFNAEYFGKGEKITNEFIQTYLMRRTQEVWAPYRAARGQYHANFYTASHEMIAASPLGQDTVISKLISEALTPERIEEFTRKSFRVADIWQERLAKIEGVRQSLQDTMMTGQLTEAQEKAIFGWLDGFADELSKVGKGRIEQYKMVGDKAWKQALDDYHIAFTNYDETTIFDQVMRNAFPFWRYESRAWPWLFRQGLSKPALGRAFMPLGWYWEATDNGYLSPPVLGTGLQVALIRGTVLGRLRRAYRGDYPTQHSGWSGAVEKQIQALERWGFYLGPLPGILAEVGVSTMDEGLATSLREVGEWAPPIVSTLAGSLITAEWGFDKAFEQIGIDMTTWREARGMPNVVDIQERLFPNRFREYYENIEIASKYKLVPSEVRRASAAGDKEMQDILLSAQRAIAWRSIIGEQISLTRFRPEEYTAMKAKVAKRVEEITGLSPEEQERVVKGGDRISDVVELNRLDRAYLAELDVYAALADITVPLQTVEKRRVLQAQEDFYSHLASYREWALGEQQRDDDALEAGPMLPSTWRDTYADRWGGLANFGDALKRSAQFSSVPLSLEERKAFSEARGWKTSPVHAIDYIIDAYYNVQPPFDANTGEYDWAAFFRYREDILASLPSDVRDQVETFLTRNETPLMREFRAGREYMQAYWDVETFVPRWFEHLGDFALARFATKLFNERKVAQREYKRLLYAGIADETARARTINNKRFRMLDGWVTRYRSLLRDPNTPPSYIPWYDSRIGDYYNKFFRV